MAVNLTKRDRRHAIPGPLVLNTMSVISSTPLDPESPTLTTTAGLTGSQNLLPEPIILLQASPTIRVPAGMVMVSVWWLASKVIQSVWPKVHIPPRKYQHRKKLFYDQNTIHESQYGFEQKPSTKLDE